MKASQIIELNPTKDDFIKGAEYAAITLPWTFNRMMENTSSNGQQTRAFNIVKGIVAQEMTKRKLDEMGIPAELERKSYRDDDLFDFQVPIEGVYTKLDLKTIHYYSDYNIKGREPLTKKLIADNSGYPGPDWRYFFPMLIPHTQVGQDKEVYCFAITSSIDFRNSIDKNRSGYALTAYPYGEAMAFLSSSKLCKLREENEQGFYIDIEYQDSSLFGNTKIPIDILGEWDGEKKKVNVTINTGKLTSNIGPFACFSSIQIARKNFDDLNGKIIIRVSRNDFKSPVLNATKRNINKPSGDLAIERDDFCNLILPDDYKMYIVGWIHKSDFLEKCKQYTGWVWPKDSINKYENQVWDQITEKDLKSLTRAGFAEAIKRKPSRINAGWMKTNGRGGGACCYVFPNIGRNGGIKETNLYVLPKDLNSFEELKHL